MKKNSERDKFYIQSMCEEIGKVGKFIEKETYKKFSKNEKLQYAVYKACENIGEAARNLSDKFKNEYPNIPWKNIIAYRNILAHEYFGVDVAETWKVAQKDIPKLKSQIKQIVVRVTKK